MAETTDGKLTQAQRRELRSRLESERHRLLESYERSLQREREVPDGQGEDLEERAEDSWTKQEIFAEAEAERNQLLLVEEALERLEKGSYGICRDCAAPIGYQRLLAVPATRYCLHHQARAERREERG